MEQWFEGKAVLVTGAGSGIGRAAAQLFALRGAKVAVTDVDRDGGNETVELIQAAGGAAFFAYGDVADMASVQAFVGATLNRYGRLDCAFNNAGISDPRDNDWDDDAFRRTINVNLVGVMNCLKCEIPALLKTGGGTIVNTASINSFVASAAVPLPAYTATKHAVVGLTKSAALQYARVNIRVNALCPGATRTKMIEDVMEASPAAREAIENLSPMGRVATPEEVAEAAIWLCSAKSSYVTGHALVVDGGVVAG